MNIKDDRDLGLVVRERRRELGLDQAAVAERVGVSRQWVVEVEKGKPRAEVGLLLRLLRALGLELDASVRGAAEPEESGRSALELIDIDAVIERSRKPEGEA